MKEKIFIRSVLEAYPFFETVLKKIDKLVVLKGVNSYGYIKTLDIMQDVMALSVRKQKIIKLKGLIEDGITNISPQNSKILMLRFFDRFTISDLANLYKTTSKVVYRLCKNALKEFCDYFYSKIINFYDLTLLLKDEEWIIGKYKKHLSDFLLKRSKFSSGYAGICY